MSSILGQIKWWNPAAGAPADIAGHYLAGRQAAERERQGAAERERMKADLALEQQKVDAQMSEKAAEEYRRREVMGQTAMLQSVGRLQKIKGADPRLYEQASLAESNRLRQGLAPIGLGFASQVPDVLPADQLEPMAQQLRQRITAASDPKRFDEIQRRAAHTLSAEIGDSSLDDPQFAREHPAWRKHLDKAIEGDKGGVTVNLGAGPNMTKATQGEQEGILTEGEKTLGFIGDLRAAGKAAGGFSNLTGIVPDMNLGWLEFKEAASQALGGKLSSADKRTLTNLTSFRGALDTFSAQLTNELLGASQAVQEWQRAKRGILNARMGSTQFESSLNHMERVTRRQMAIARQILSEGVLRKGSEAFGQEVDRRNRRAMMDEMRADGLTPDQIAEEIATYGID